VVARGDGRVCGSRQKHSGCGYRGKTLAFIIGDETVLHLDSEDEYMNVHK
jgi:hypothetical protein